MHTFELWFLAPLIYAQYFFYFLRHIRVYMSRSNHKIDVSMMARVDICIRKFKKKNSKIFTPQMAEYMPKYLRAHEFYFCSCKNNVLRTFYKKIQNLIPWASAAMSHFWCIIFIFFAFLNWLFSRCPRYHINIFILI